jgi:hypothetical protein
MANRTVIEESDNVKASQLKEFFRQIDEKVVTGRSLQAFIEYRNPFGPEPPRFSIQKFVDLITGSEHVSLSLNKFYEWKSLLLYEVTAMRKYYENYAKLKPNDSTVEYYAPCWKLFDRAKDDFDLTKAIIYLVDSMRLN